MRPSLLVVFAATLLATRVDAKGAKPAPEVTAITAAINDQFAGFRQPARESSLYAKNAMISMTGATVSPQVNRASDAEGKWTIFGPSKVGKHTLKDVRIGIAKDGQSGWASFIARVAVDGLDKSGTFDYRVTEMFVKNGDAWQVQAAAWSLGIANAALAKAVKDAKLGALEDVFGQNLGDRDVIGAALSLVKSGLDESAKARTDVVGIDTVPGAATVGGKKLAAKLAKEWVDKVVADKSTWAVTAGTTASATLNVKLTRAGGTVPGRLFAIFEKDSAGAWSPVVVHLAAAPPT